MTAARSAPHWLPALLAMALIAALCVPLAAWGMCRRARLAADAARAEYLGVEGQVREVERLRAQRASVSDRQRPTGDLVEPFKAMLHSAGLPPSSLTHISSPDPQPVSGTRLFRQQFAITLERARVQDLVRVLHQWRSDQPLWTPRSIRLELPATSGRATGGPVDDRYTAMVTIENIFLTEPPARTPGASVGEGQVSPGAPARSGAH